MVDRRFCDVCDTVLVVNKQRNDGNFDYIFEIPKIDPLEIRIQNKKVYFSYETYTIHKNQHGDKEKKHIHVCFDCLAEAIITLKENRDGREGFK